MKGSYLNDGFFNRLETLSLELRADLAGFFGGKHLQDAYFNGEKISGLIYGGTRIFAERMKRWLSGCEVVCG